MKSKSKFKSLRKKKYLSKKNKKKRTRKYKKVKKGGSKLNATVTAFTPRSAMPAFTLPRIPPPQLLPRLPPQPIPLFNQYIGKRFPKVTIRNVIELLNKMSAILGAIITECLISRPAEIDAAKPEDKDSLEQTYNKDCSTKGKKLPTEADLEAELLKTIDAETKISKWVGLSYNQFLKYFANEFEKYTGYTLYIAGGYAWDFHNMNINQRTATKTTNDADFKICLEPGIRPKLNQSFLVSIFQMLDLTLQNPMEPNTKDFGNYYRFFHSPSQRDKHGLDIHDYLHRNEGDITEHPISIDQKKPIKISYNSNPGSPRKRGVPFHILLEFTQISEKPALGIVEQRNEITDIPSLESFFNTSIRRRLADGDSNVYPIKLKSWKKQLDFLIDYMKKGINLSYNPDDLFFTLDELALNLIKNLFKSNELGVNSNNNNSNNNNLPNLIRP